MAAGAAAAAGALGVASRAAAAQKRAMSGGGLSDPYWFYVAASTEVYGLENYETVVGRLVPGDWYMAKATYDEWVHAFDEPSGLEGWIARSSAIAHGEPEPTP